ncbi:glycoside hydrolase family 5 protein [Bythopirellula goksoeyrii]|uniref:Endoglucanase n=1 Tax=Bythopirellula goksoeyrii TaxID=1400387 RepID=A0A5B9QID2_9BACT|nr:glycoside hydrolase family 5 protein [Bythopirellula goksoeyrii]QEG33981.1 Endoglucanase precursor [Bythopirellula goksoeyrii]
MRMKHIYISCWMPIVGFCLSSLGIAGVTLAFATFLNPANCSGQIRFTGVNLFGAEFGESSLPGNYGQHYTYPIAAEVDYFLGEGMNTFRLPFRWERLQRSALAPLDATELSRMDTFVNYATSQGANVILDPHNFMRYFPDPNNFQTSSQGLVGVDPNVPISVFSDFWSQIADHYKDNDRVIFNLMNEPNSMQTSELVVAENAAIAAIRETGAENLILVPGNQWSGAWAWNETWYNGPNAVHMLNITDPLNNYAFDVHQYLDNNSSGGSQGIVSATIGQERLVNFTNWLQANNLRGFLGEFAVGDSTIGNGPSQIGDEAIDNMLSYMEANDDVWLGWAWWAAGPWYTNYFFSLEPNNLGQPNQSDRIQMDVLRPHFADVLGDLDGDGDVDEDDHGIWANAYALDDQGDIDGDGDTDGSDFLVWQRELWKTTTDRSQAFGATTAVPEPTSISLLLFLASASIAHRKAKLT